MSHVDASSSILILHDEALDPLPFLQRESQGVPLQFNFVLSNQPLSVPLKQRLVSGLVLT